MCVSARSCSPATHCESSCIFEGQFSAFPHCSFYLFVNPIFTLSTVLVSPYRKPCLHPFLIAPFTFLSTLYSTYLQCLFHPPISPIFTLSFYSFHLSVNSIFNLSSVPVSPSSKPTLQPFFNFFFHLLANQNLHLLSIAPFTL